MLKLTVYDHKVGRLKEIEVEIIREYIFLK